MVIVAAVFFAMCVYASIREAIAECDWPRDTFRFVLVSGLALILSIAY